MKMLGIIANELEKIGIPYSFMRWNTVAQYPYWVGEYAESPTENEDGYKEYTMMLTGTTNGDSWSALEEQKNTIESHFPMVYGLRTTTDNGSVAIFYQQAFPIDTGDANLKRIQVNLLVKEWKGSI